MVRKKKIRTRGKIKLSKYFQELKKGDSVAISQDRTLQPKFPSRINGKTGIIEGKRGKAYIINIKDQNKEKKFLIEPVHLKKIKQIKVQ